MRKIFGLAVLGVTIAAGSLGAIVASLTAIEPPLQAFYPPVADRSQPLANGAIAQDARPTREAAPQTQEVARFDRIMGDAANRGLPDRPMGEIVQEIAKQFLGAQYKANLLDGSKEETLIISLDKFDCVLFVETVLAIAHGVAIQDYSYPTFTDRIVDRRYRHGEMDGYCSRLHYFSEWIFDNQERGNVADIAGQMGGIRLNKKLNYIGSHRQNYAPMANNDANYQCFLDMETKLDRLTLNYVPLPQIRRTYAQLQPGDIVAVATSIPGLDVTHTGLVYRNQNGSMGIIHASPSGTVRISRDLQLYVANVRNAIGILVARPTDPRLRNSPSQR